MNINTFKKNVYSCTKYMLYVCIFIYTHNKYTQYTHIYIYVQKQKLILDAINRD